MISSCEVVIEPQSAVRASKPGLAEPLALILPRLLSAYGIEPVVTNLDDELTGASPSARRSARNTSEPIREELRCAVA